MAAASAGAGSLRRPAIPRVPQLPKRTALRSFGVEVLSVRTFNFEAVSRPTRVFQTSNGRTDSDRNGSSQTNLQRWAVRLLSCALHSVPPHMYCTRQRDRRFPPEVVLAVAPCMHVQCGSHASICVLNWSARPPTPNPVKIPLRLAGPPPVPRELTQSSTRHGNRHPTKPGTRPTSLRVLAEFPPLN